MRRLLNPLAYALLAALLSVAAGRAEAVTYMIEVQYGGPGTVTPSGNVEVPEGGSQTFTFTPSGCYSVGEVTVDNIPVGVGLTGYTFHNVQSDHVLYVPFGARSTTTALDVRPVYGQCAVPETLTATVANSNGGQVQFFNGATLLGTRTLVSGVATYIVASGLTAGSYTFSANYLGTGCSEPSDSPGVAYNVAETGPVPMTLVLTVSDHSIPANFVDLSTTLRIGNTPSATQSGHVTFYDGATVLGTTTMTGNYATRRFTMTTLGDHVITAVAQLSLCSTTVLSQPETLHVYDPVTTPTLTLTVTPNPASVGGYVTLRVISWFDLNRPIHFLDITNSVEVGSAALQRVGGTDQGVATFLYGPLSGSNRTMQARYDGDPGRYYASVSNQVNLGIGPQPPPPAPPLYAPPFLSYGTGQTPYAVAISDLNADGRPDLATANVGANTASVLLGNGDGTFGARTDFGTGSDPSAVAIADLNADGRPDLALATDSGASVLLGNGNGTFAPVSNFGTGCNGVAIGDLNADGKPDLAVVSYFPNTVSVLLGNGDGTFAPNTDFGTGAHPASVAIADLNGDGRLDLVVADAHNGGGVSVLLGNGDGTFGLRSSFGTGQDPPWVAVADLNGDGLLDLVAANWGPNGNGNSVSVLLGNGNGTFGPKTDFNTGYSPNSVAIADLNADGRLDLVVANAYAATSPTPGQSVLLGNGNGTFGDMTTYTDGVYYSVAIADLNTDGRPDVVLSGNSSRVTVLLHADIPVATLLAQFDATTGSDGIELRWSFEDASRVSSATVERGPNAIGPWTPITAELRHDGEVMVVLDRTTDPGQTYFYRLNVKFVDGSNARFGPISSTSSAFIGESAVSLLGPNPTRETSQIQYVVARAGHVRLDVADVAGRLVTTLIEGSQRAGRFQLAWDGTNRGERLPAGLYFVRLTTVDRSVAKKITKLP